MCIRDRNHLAGATPDAEHPGELAAPAPGAPEPDLRVPLGVQEAPPADVPVAPRIVAGEGRRVQLGRGDRPRRVGPGADGAPGDRHRRVNRLQPEGVGRRDPAGRAGRVDGVRATANLAERVRRHAHSLRRAGPPDLSAGTDFRHVTARPAASDCPRPAWPARCGRASPRSAPRCAGARRSPGSPARSQPARRSPAHGR